MTGETGVPAVHLGGEQPAVELADDEPVAAADNFAGRVHLEWEPAAPVTTMGQLAFFIEYLKQGGLFDGWVAGCPLYLTSPNAPAKRDVLGTVLLSVLAGHWRYAHITALRADAVNAPLLGMKTAISAVFTIGYVANLLGDDEDWLHALSIDLFSEDGGLRV